MIVIRFDILSADERAEYETLVDERASKEPAYCTSCGQEAELDDANCQVCSGELSG